MNTMMTTPSRPTVFSEGVYVLEQDGNDHHQHSSSSNNNHNNHNNNRGKFPRMSELTTERSLKNITDERTTASPDYFDVDESRENHGAFIKCFGVLLDDKRFQMVVIVLIILNSLTLGLATFDFVTENPNVESIFEAVDQAFLVIFTIELVMQFLYHGIALFEEGWLSFDVLVVSLSWAFASVQVVRAFRIARAFRLITRIQDLKDLVHALLSVVPRMCAIFLLLLLVDYVFAVMFTSLFKNMYADGYLDGDYFGRLDRTAFTMFQLMTLDGWSSIARQVLAVHGWAWLPFVTFVAISSFIVINLMIAVICDAVSALQKDKLEEKLDDFKSMAESRNHMDIDDMRLLHEKVDKLQQTVLLLTQKLEQKGQ